MRSRPTVSEVAQHFSEYIDRVAHRGERFVLMQGQKPVAELGPVVPSLKLRELPALLASLPQLSPEEAAAFESDLSEIRSELNQLPLRDPWES